MSGLPVLGSMTNRVGPTTGAMPGREYDPSARDRTAEHDDANTSASANKNV
jgi:hypothetical protein